MAHQVEGMRGLADLERAARPEVADVAALAEAVGGPGELADRADLQAQEIDRDCAQHDRPADHPGQQEPGRRAGHPFPGHADQQHALCDLGVDVEAIGVFGLQIDGEWVVQSFVEAFKDFAVDMANAGVDRRRRHGIGQRQSALELDREPCVAAGTPDLRVARGVIGSLLDHLGQQRHLAGDPERQRAGHRIPMAIVEDDREQQLQDQQRHHDDQQRAPEQAARDNLMIEELPQARQHAQPPSRST